MKCLCLLSVLIGGGLLLAAVGCRTVPAGQNLILQISTNTIDSAIMKRVARAAQAVVDEANKSRKPSLATYVLDDYSLGVTREMASGAAQYRFEYKLRKMVGRGFPNFFEIVVNNDGTMNVSLGR